MKEIFMKVLNNNSIPRQMILNLEYIKCIQHHLCRVQMSTDTDDIQFYGLLREFIVKFILNIKDYFYIPQESQINNTIKKYVIKTNMIFNILLMLKHEQDQQLVKDIKKKFLIYLTLEHWNMISVKFSIMAYKYVQFDFPDED